MSELERSAATGAAAAQILGEFADAWAEPRLETFVRLFHDDVCLRQPVTAPIRGRAAAREEFARLLRWLPDLRGTVDQTAVHGDLALIAWRLRFTLGGGPFELRIVDRIVVADALVVEREAYYDSLRFMLVLLSRPTAWPGYLRYRGYL